MPRPGRALEELVQLLERLLSNTSVEIKSPDFIVGHMSGTRREVDVSLRSKVGSTEILVIIECRDRNDTEDVTWIEQLATKCKDVGAAKAVAVSPVGFTSGAQRMAENQKIELRTFEDVNEPAVFNWLHIDTVEVRVRYVNIISVGLDVADPSAEMVGESQDVLKPGAIQRTTPVLVRKSDGTAVSLDDIWQSTPGVGEAFDKAFEGKPAGQIDRGTLRIDFPDPAARYALNTTDGLMDIEVISITGDFSYQESLAAIGRRYTYRDSSGAIVESAEATFHHEGAEIIFGMHATPSGSQILITGGQRNPGGKAVYVDVKAAIEVSDKTN